MFWGAEEQAVCTVWRLLLLHTVHTACSLAPQDISWQQFGCRKPHAVIYSEALLKMGKNCPKRVDLMEY
jgi:hypothetical protein